MKDISSKYSYLFPLLLVIMGVLGSVAVWWFRNDVAGSDSRDVSGFFHGAMLEEDDSRIADEQATPDSVLVVGRGDFSGGDAGALRPTPERPGEIQEGGSVFGGHRTDGVAENGGPAQSVIGTDVAGDDVLVKPVRRIDAGPAHFRESDRAGDRGVTPVAEEYESKTARSNPPVLDSDRPLDLPVAMLEDPPPPPGLAHLKSGSIPLENVLELDGVVVNSFSIGRKNLVPGEHTVRIVSSKGCVRFSVQLEPNETVHLIWDFDLNNWRRNERVMADGRTPLTPMVQECGSGQ